MKRRSRWLWIHFRWQHLKLRLVRYWIICVDEWDDVRFWIASFRRRAFVAESDFHGCFSNRTRLERLELYVSGERRMVESYLANIAGYVLPEVRQ